MVEVGDEAPEFELPDQTGQPVRLSDFRGKKHVVLVFYPFTFTATAAEDLSTVRDRIDHLRTDDVETLAVSVDAPPVHRAWADQQGFEFPILADFWPHGRVAQDFGVFDESLGTARRATFVVDREGVVRYRDVGDLGEPRDAERWREALEKLGPS